jgi:hypothetical protein
MIDCGPKELKMRSIKNDFPQYFPVILLFGLTKEKAGMQTHNGFF